MICNKSIPKRIDSFQVQVPKETYDKLVKKPSRLNCGDEFVYRGNYWIVTADHFNGMIDIDEIISRDFLKRPTSFGHYRRCIYRDEI